MSQRSGRWIPPWGLVAGQLAHGLSWIALLELARAGRLGATLAGLGWLHLVTLGWLTLTALSVLVHVIPAFTDAPWRGEAIARGALTVYAAGVATLVIAFWTGSRAALPGSASLVGIGLLGYLVPAALTLAGALRLDRTSAAIARALFVTLSFLLATALLGIAFAFALGRGRFGGSLLLVGVGPPIHAGLGIIGWLTLLVMGVSVRTVRPITGARSRFPLAHVLVGMLLIVGLIIASVAALWRSGTAMWCGVALLVVAIAIYAFDLLDVLRRAQVAHRPPQAFLGAAVFWLAVAVALGLGTLAGEPWGEAFVYASVIGWVGQAVNAHLHHIGIRLLATMIRGDEDETRPGTLVSHRLGWLAFACAQAATALGITAFLRSAPAWLLTASLFGLGSWIAMAANVGVARRRALRRAEVAT